MVGLTILAAVAIYIAAVYWLARMTRPIWGKAAVILAALAIPFWDWPIGYVNFQQHCTTDGGLRTYQKSPPINAVLMDSGAPFTPESAFRQGIKVVEYKKNATVTRHVADKPSTTSDGSLQSVIRLSGTRNQLLPWNLLRNDIVAIRISDGQMLAKHSDFTWLGTWWQARSAPYFGYGMTCFRDSSPLLALVARGNQ